MHIRDLADPRHARTSLRASLLVAVLTLCVAASGAFALSREQTVAVQEKVGVTADGVVGPQTRAAIKRFQRRNGLAVDGIAGPQTLAAMGISPASARAARNTARAGTAGARLESIARCESGGDPTAVSPDGRYRGKYQFSRATWRSLGGTGDPAAAPETEQDRLAALLLQRQGPSAWPSCT